MQALEKLKDNITYSTILMDKMELRFLQGRKQLNKIVEKMNTKDLYLRWIEKLMR